MAKKKHPHLLLKLLLPHLLLPLLLLTLPLLLPLLLLHLLKRRSNFFCFRKTPPSGGLFSLVATTQRWPTGLTLRCSAPTYSWRGRPILYSGSPIISLSWAIQPTVRANAKIAVNNCTGMPMARWTMPE